MKTVVSLILAVDRLESILGPVNRQVLSDQIENSTLESKAQV